LLYELSIKFLYKYYNSFQAECKLFEQCIHTLVKFYHCNWCNTSKERNIIWIQFFLIWFLSESHPQCLPRKIRNPNLLLVDNCEGSFSRIVEEIGDISKRHPFTICVVLVLHLVGVACWRNILFVILTQYSASVINLHW